MSTTRAIRAAIRELPKGKPFTSAHFLKHGPRGSVDRALSRLVREGQTQRVSRGVFVRPKTSRFVGTVLPNVLQVVEAIARGTGETVQIHGAEAARRLRLSTQVPTAPAFLTSRAVHGRSGMQTTRLAASPTPDAGGRLVGYMIALGLFGALMMSGCSTATAPSAAEPVVPVVTIVSTTDSATAGMDLEFEVQAAPVPQDSLTVEIGFSAVGCELAYASKSAIIASGETKAPFAAETAGVQVNEGGCTVTAVIIAGDRYRVGDAGSSARATIDVDTESDGGVPTVTPPGQTPPGQTPPGQTPPGQTPPGQIPPSQTLPDGVQPPQTPAPKNPLSYTPPSYTVTIAPDGSEAEEGTSAWFTVTAYPEPTKSLAVYMVSSTSGSFLQNENYPYQRVYTIPADGTMRLYANTVDDDDDEENGSITYTITWVFSYYNVTDGYTVGTPSSATVTITDNDQP